MGGVLTYDPTEPLSFPPQYNILFAISSRSVLLPTLSPLLLFYPANHQQEAWSCSRLIPVERARLLPLFLI